MSAPSRIFQGEGADNCSIPVRCRADGLRIQQLQRVFSVYWVCRPAKPKIEPHQTGGENDADPSQELSDGCSRNKITRPAAGNILWKFCDHQTNRRDQKIKCNHQKFPRISVSSW